MLVGIHDQCDGGLFHLIDFAAFWISLSDHETASEYKSWSLRALCQELSAAVSSQDAVLHLLHGLSWLQPACFYFQGLFNSF
jgi:hypothetical protein